MNFNFPNFLVIFFLLSGISLCSGLVGQLLFYQISAVVPKIRTWRLLRLLMVTLFSVGFLLFLFFAKGDGLELEAQTFDAFFDHYGGLPMVQERLTEYPHGWGEGWPECSRVIGILLAFVITSGSICLVCFGFRRKED